MDKDSYLVGSECGEDFRVPVRRVSNLTRPQ